MPLSLSRRRGPTSTSRRPSVLLLLLLRRRRRRRRGPSHRISMKCRLSTSKIASCHCTRSMQSPPSAWRTSGRTLGGSRGSRKTSLACVWSGLRQTGRDMTPPFLVLPYILNCLVLLSPSTFGQKQTHMAIAQHVSCVGQVHMSRLNLFQIPTFFSFPFFACQHPSETRNGGFLNVTWRREEDNITRERECVCVCETQRASVVVSAVALSDFPLLETITTYWPMGIYTDLGQTSMYGINAPPLPPSPAPREYVRCSIEMMVDEQSANSAEHHLRATRLAWHSHLGPDMIGPVRGRS